MAICRDCKQEMKTATTCRHPLTIMVNGKRMKRDTTHYDDNRRCHDCGIVNNPGNLHHLGCDMERCPNCGMQLISCKCRKNFA